jgi:hypothetical protein
MPLLASSTQNQSANAKSSTASTIRRKDTSTEGLKELKDLKQSIASSQSFFFKTLSAAALLKGSNHRMSARSQDMLRLGHIDYHALQEARDLWRQCYDSTIEKRASFGDWEDEAALNSGLKAFKTKLTSSKSNVSLPAV